MPVVDLSARLGQEETEINRRTCVVILEALLGEETQVVGFMVDAVSPFGFLQRKKIDTARISGCRVIDLWRFSLSLLIRRSLVRVKVGEPNTKKPTAM